MSSTLESLLASPTALVSTSILSFILARAIISRVRKNGPIPYAPKVIKYNSYAYSIFSLFLCMNVTASIWDEISRSSDPSITALICSSSSSKFDRKLRYFYHASKIYEYVDIFNVLAEDRHLITYTSPSEIQKVSEWSPMLESPLPPRLENEFTIEEIAAGSSLLQYVKTRLQGSNMKLQPPTRQLDVLGIDKNTMRALEIKKTMREDMATGSLLHTTRRTVTKGGARLLDNWLSLYIV